MPRRTTVLFILLAVGLLIAAALSGAVAPALQVAVMASFAVLGLFAVLVLNKVGLRPHLQRNRLAGEDRGLRRLQRLSAELELDSAGGLEVSRQEVEVYQWPETSDDRQDPRFLRAPLDEHAIAQHLAQRLVPPAPETSADETQSGQRELLAELVREGDNLKSLGQLLKLDLVAYGNQLSKGIAAARRNRIEECVLILQLANERLRKDVQTGLAKTLSPIRIRPAFGGR